MQKRTIWLFDVDGVLVQPGGYRASLRDTLDGLRDDMGLPPIALSDDVIALFEAEGITCEWDMLPLLLAMTIDPLLARLPQAKEIQSLADLFAEISYSRIDDVLNRDDLDESAYASRIRGLGQFTRDGEAPADTFLRLLQAGGEAAARTPALAGCHPALLHEIFAETRNPAASLTTAWFESLALGSDVYAQWMNLPAPVASPSLLDLHDHPLLDAPTRDDLLAALRAGALRAVIFTARPSLPLQAPSLPLALFAPEAEAAQRLVGLDMLPLIGSGQMAALALEVGEAEDRLTKPALYHALAAIVAGFTGKRAAALDWTRRAFLCAERNMLTPAADWAGGEALHVTVFEDSPSGMRAVIRAGELLRQFGVTVDVRLCGVTTHPDKQRALEALGAQVYPSINAAIRACL